MKKRTEETNDFEPVLSDCPQHDAQRARDTRRYYCDLVLTVISSFGGSFILLSFFAANDFGGFFAAAALCGCTAFLTCQIEDASSGLR